MTLNVSRTISVQIDDELFIRLENAMQIAAAELGVPRVSKSVFLRRLLAMALEDPKPLFDQGWMEGYYAAFAAAMRSIANTLSEISADPSRVRGLGLGMSSPYFERDGTG